MSSVGVNRDKDLRTVEHVIHGGFSNFSVPEVSRLEDWYCYYRPSQGYRNFPWSTFGSEYVMRRHDITSLNSVRDSAISGMASPRVIQAAVDRRTADLVHEELLNFIQNHSPGAVQKGQDKIFSFDNQLEQMTFELQRTSAAVKEFLSKTGRVIAANFLGVPLEEVKYGRSFLILYCSRATKRNARGGGRVTIFLALGELSISNGLPTIGDTSQVLGSGDALAVRSEETQTLGETGGGGIALVSDWT